MSIPVLWQRAVANEIAYWSQLSVVHTRLDGVFFVHDVYTAPPVNSAYAAHVPLGCEMAFARGARDFYIQRGRSAQLQVAPWVVSPSLQGALVDVGWIRATDISVMSTDVLLDPTSAPPDISIRLATSEDMVTWTTILARCFDLPEQAAFLNALRIGFLQGSVVSYLAEWQGEPAGCAQLFLEAEMGGIYAVGTLPAFRHRGIARTLLARILDDAMSRCGQVCLQTVANSIAEHIYHGLGFRRLFVHECYYLPLLGRKYQPV
jgi:ribosomal protein S18 acetylase RimI-like enzyme